MDAMQQELLNKISEYQFVCNELQLYLDTHPGEQDARADYICYAEKLNDVMADYENTYGPLLNFGLSPTDTGCWVCSDWPWEA